MKTSLIALIWIAMAFAAAAQAPSNKQTLLDRPSPDDPQPGLICRVHLDGSTNAKEFPTHLLAVVQTGDEFNKQHKPTAQNEMRGLTKTQGLFYVAFGHLILEKDAEVKFDMGKAVVMLRGKDFGGGSYTMKLKAGKYPIEITRQWGQGQGGFSIIDTATQKTVLFHTQDMLDRELKRSYKLEGKTFKSKRLDAPTAG